MTIIPNIVNWTIGHFTLVRVFIIFISIALLCLTVNQFLVRRFGVGALMGVMGLLGVLFSFFYKPVLFWLLKRYPYVLLGLSLLTLSLTITVGLRLFKRQFNVTTLLLLAVTFFLWMFVIHYWTHIPYVPESSDPGIGQHKQ